MSRKKSRIEKRHEKSKKFFAIFSQGLSLCLLPRENGHLRGDVFLKGG